MGIFNADLKERRKIGSLELLKGAKGDKGDKGAKGDKGDSYKIGYQTFNCGRFLMTPSNWTSSSNVSRFTIFTNDTIINNNNRMVEILPPEHQGFGIAEYFKPNSTETLTFTLPSDKDNWNKGLKYDTGYTLRIEAYAPRGNITLGAPLVVRNIGSVQNRKNGLIRTPNTAFQEMGFITGIRLTGKISFTLSHTYIRNQTIIIYIAIVHGILDRNTYMNPIVFDQYT